MLSPSLLLHIIWTSMVGNRKAKTSSTGLLPVKERLAYFLEIKTLLKNGNIKTVVSQEYSLSQIVDAHKYVETGRKVGNVVVSI